MGWVGKLEFSADPIFSDETAGVLGVKGLLVAELFLPPITWDKRGRACLAEPFCMSVPARGEPL